MSHLHISLIPRVSEKSYAGVSRNIYVFDAPLTANKQQISAAVAEQFKVVVTGVTTLVAKGKAIRTVRNGKAIPGSRNDYKKAYVTLAEGSKIAAFEQKEAK